MMAQLHLLYLTVIFVCLAEGYWFGQRYPWQAYQELLRTARTILNWMGSFGTSSAVFVGPHLWARSFSSCCRINTTHHSCIRKDKRAVQGPHEASDCIVRTLQSVSSLGHAYQDLRHAFISTHGNAQKIHEHSGGSSSVSYAVTGAGKSNLRPWKVRPRILEYLYLSYMYNSTLCTFIWCIF